MMLVTASLGGEETKRLVPGLRLALKTRRRDSSIAHITATNNLEPINSVDLSKVQPSSHSYFVRLGTENLLSFNYLKLKGSQFKLAKKFFYLGPLDNHPSDS